jgi:hypothetical protein
VLLFRAHSTDCVLLGFVALWLILDRAAALLDMAIAWMVASAQDASPRYLDYNTTISLCFEPGVVCCS